MVTAAPSRVRRTPSTCGPPQHPHARSDFANVALLRLAPLDPSGSIRPPRPRGWLFAAMPSRSPRPGSGCSVNVGRGGCRSTSPTRLSRRQWEVTWLPLPVAHRSQASLERPAQRPAPAVGSAERCARRSPRLACCCCCCCGPDLRREEAVGVLASLPGAKARSPSTCGSSRTPRRRADRCDPHLSLFLDR